MYLKLIKSSIFLLLVCLLGLNIGCDKNDDIESRVDVFVPTDVIVKTKVGFRIAKVFDFINSFDHDVEHIKYGIYNSSFPSDSLQYVLNYLNAKPYTYDGKTGSVTGYLHSQTKQITIFPKLFQIKNKEYQTDWLQSLEILQLTENSTSEVGGNVIYFHVPEGKEIEWVNKFKTYDFVEWAELNYYAELNPWP